MDIFERLLMLAFLCAAASVPARGAEVVGVVEMPELCSTAVSPAVVRLEPIDSSRAGLTRKPSVERDYFIDQRKLMFEPRVVGMPVGATLRFGNADPEPHNVHVEGKGVHFNQVVPPGGSVELIPTESGVLRVLCDVHTHMRAYIIVGSTPWVTSCGRGGEFRLLDVPKGQYRLTVWHEMGSPAKRDVEVGDSRVDLGVIRAPAGSNTATLDDRGQVCEKGCEPWPLIIDRISMTLAESFDASQHPGSRTRAVPLVQDALYRDFESSGMGTAIRVHLGRERATRVEDLFREIEHRTSDADVTNKTPTERLAQPTREVLLSLVQASAELNRKGVTERSKIFTATSPAFWLKDTPPAAAVKARTFSEAFGSAFREIVLASAGAVLLWAFVNALLIRGQAPNQERRFELKALVASLSGVVAAVVASWAVGRRGGGGELESMVAGAGLLATAIALFHSSLTVLDRTLGAEGATDSAVGKFNHAGWMAACFFACFTAGFPLASQRWGAPEPAATFAAGSIGFATGLTAAVGFLAGAAIVVGRLATRLRQRIFWTAAGVMCVAAALALAGQGTHSLQAARLVQSTPVPGMGAGVPALGLYPNVQCLELQAVFGVGLLLVALRWFVARGRWRSLVGLEPDTALIHGNDR